MGSELYISLSAGAQALKQLDSVSNNLANLQSVGYRADRPCFRVALPQAARQQPGTPQARLAAGFLTPDGVVVDYTQGALQTTGGTTDLAITGDGFFALQGQDGLLLTRDGSFELDDQGSLVTRDGLPVLDAQQAPITVRGSGALQIDADGTVRVGGVRAGRVGVYDLTDRAAMEKVAGNRFAVAPDTKLEAGQGDVKQGYLESSNVEPVKALTELITVTRYYEAFQRNIRTVDEIEEQLSSRVARLTE